MTALAHAEFGTFMDHYAPAMGFEISYDDYHEFKLEIGRVLQENEHITSDNFQDVEEPELVDDDQILLFLIFKDKVVLILNSRTPLKVLHVEDKHIIWKQMMTTG